MKRTCFASILLILGSLMPVTAAALGSTEFVYVESNIQSANGNSIFAFSRNADGSLTALPGSPFATGGTGVQDRSFVFGPYDSDQNLVVDPERQLLFAVNSGSDTIAVFHINGDGSLAVLPGSPFPSGGTNPVSLGVSGNILFVVNKNGDFARESSLQPNYTAMRILDDGSLTPVKNSTVNVAYESSPSQALVVPGTNLVFGNDFRGGLLETFNVDADGHLHQRPAVALPPDPNIPVLDLYGTPLRLGNLPLGLTLHPKLPLLYVGFVVESTLGVYSFNDEGDLKFVRTVPNSGLAICWLRSNRSGTRLYTSNNGVVGDPVHDPFSTVSVYDLSDPETPREIQNLQLQGFGNASQIELSSDDRFVYLIGQRATKYIPEGQGNALHVFTVLADGTLSEDNPPVQLNVPVGTQPQGIAVFSPR
jgi:6-phosphogluconolactonase (cycloisomerase 2 family)